MCWASSATLKSEDDLWDHLQKTVCWGIRHSSCSCKTCLYAELSQFFDKTFADNSVYNFAFYRKIRTFWFRKTNPFLGADCQCFCPSSHNTVSSRKIFWKGPFSFSWRLHSCRGLAFICRFNGLISIRTSNYTVTNRNTILLSIFGTINFFYVKLNIDAVKWLHLRGINYKYSSPVSLAQILHSYTVTI